MTDIKRREFIKMSAGAGIATLGVSKVIQNKPGESIDAIQAHERRFNASKKIIVAGGGIGGLCCGYELMKKGHDVVVLEASGRHGGHVFTARDGLSDGLYADFGAEHITKPGYERYWEYTKEFNLDVLYYPRRENQLRRIDGRFYTEAMLSDPSELKKLGFNEREIQYLSQNPWTELRSLYNKPYLDKFTDEYQPFGVGYDNLDTISLTDFFKKDGASPAALRFMGSTTSSALYELWQGGILKLRGVPLSPPKLYRLKGGNQGLPNEFAKRLGSRVRLNSPVLSIKHGQSGVTIRYKEFNEEKEMSADFFVCCIPPPAFRSIPVEPAFPPEKQYVIDNVTYDSYSRVVFQARSKFWLEDKLSINLDLDHPDIYNLWQVADEVETHRVVLMASCPGGISAQRALAGLRQVYPGKRDTIELALVKDWTKESFAYTCERLPFPMGELKKFWPNVIKPHGRIYFAGAYADNLNWGMEASTRSAYRAADEIDKA
jgi:monoamine oxidase